MARAFNGTTQYLSNANAIVIAAPFSVATWVKPTDDTTLQTIFCIQDSGVINDRYRLRIDYHAGDDKLRWVAAQTPGGTAIAASSATVTSGAWSHVGAVETSATSRKVFLNGTGTAGETTNVTPNNLDITYLGYSSDAAYLNGLMGEGGLWNAALIDAEFAILAKGLSPLAVRPQSLVAYWPLIGHTSPEIDIVGGYDMTLNNGPTTAAHPPVMYPVSPHSMYRFPVGLTALELNHSPGNLAAWKTGVRIVSP